MRRITAADISAAGRLLRDLQKPAALRKNHLVAHLFTHRSSASDALALRSVRAVVCSAVESLRSVPRQHGVIARYELARESRHAVARDLGIHERTLYYERTAALRRIVQHIWRCDETSTAPAVSVLEETFFLQQRAAIALKDSGSVELAIALLQNIVTQTTDTSRRVEALADLADAFCSSALLKEAGETIHAARRVIREGDLHENQKLLLTARADYAAVQLAWAKGNAIAALQIGERARSILRVQSQSGAIIPRVQLVALSVPIGDIHTNLGMLKEAEADFTEGLKMLNASNEFSTRLRASLLASLAFTQAVMPQNIRAARKTNSQVLKLATQNGVLWSVVQAHVNESQFRYWQGDLRMALRHSRIAQPIANVVCDSVECARVSVLHARIEALCGAERSGLQRLRFARKALPINSYLWILSKIIESHVLERLGSHTAALQAAAIAAERAEWTGNERGKGMATLAMAESYESQGDRRLALEALSRSIPALQKSGSPFPLAQAFLCSSRLGGNAGHARNAADLLESFAQ